MELTKKFNIAIDNIKKYDTRKIGSNVKFINKYVRIILMYLISYIPIILSHIFLFVFKSVDSYTKTSVFESVAYVQTLLLSIISYGIFFICQIASKIQHELNLTHRKQQPKSVIDTGISVLLTVTLFSILVFVLTSIIFVELKSSNNNSEIKQLVYNYTAIFVPYIIFLIVGHYFMHISLISGFNWIKIFIGCFFSMIIEIILIFVFLNYALSFNPLLAISIPSLIIAVLRCLIFLFVYLMKIDYFHHDEKKRYFDFNKKIYIGLFKASALSSIFMFAFMISNVIQTIFIVMSNSWGNINTDYLWTKNNNSLLLMTKILVYNFLYLIFCSSKSFGLTIIEHEDIEQLSYHQKVIRSKKLELYSLYINMFNILLCIVVLFSIGPMINLLFSNFSWAYDDVNNLPINIHNVKNNIELIAKMSQSAILIGMFSYFLMELTINLRFIVFKFFKRNYKMFATIIIGYIFSFTVLTFLFVFKTNNFFYGLNGYLIPIIIYGIFCLITTYLFNTYKQYDKYKENFPSILKNTTRLKFMYKKLYIDFLLNKLK